MQEWLAWMAVMSFLLNLLLLPLLKFVWDVRGQLIQLNGKVADHRHRIERLERVQDAA